MQNYTILGLMSGTSLDGLDIACCRFSVHGKEIKEFDLVHGKTFPYAETLRVKLEEAPQIDGDALSRLDVELGKWMGGCTKSFLKEYKAAPFLISSHGHTVFHQPGKGYTLQIGNANTIHAITQIPVAYDFRTLDIALGGQGAPLVPIGDLHLFPGYQGCLNLGGFANVSFNDKEIGRIAFDICAVNLVLNTLSKRQGMEMDRNGMLAATGKLIPSLLKRLNDLDFYNKSYPKSLGREWFDEILSPILNENPRQGNSDLMYTYCEHIAIQIGKQLRIHLSANTENEVLVTGGGTYNNHLMKRLREHTESHIKLVVPDDTLIQYKEALIFALMGLLLVRGETNCLSSVTGAVRDSCTGSVVGKANMDISTSE